MASIARSRTGANPGVRLALWVFLSLAPMAGYALPLWQSALADTPLAYLVWVPLLAMGWGVWSLVSLRTYTDDNELDALLGFGLAAAAGFLMVLGLAQWPYAFVGQSVGLLMWPLWSLGIAWLLFGLGVSRALLAPLAYLVLAWPPILSLLATWTQGILVHFAVQAIAAVVPMVSWMQTQNLATGVFLVRTGHVWSSVQVSTACSGADSVLAVLIVLPILLTQYTGSLWRKISLIAGAMVLAIALNLLRLGLVISSVHYLGNNTAFGVVHPMLGFVLFAALVAVMNALALRIGLAGRPAQTHPAGLAAAGLGRLGTAVAMSAAVFVLLLPLWSLGPGAPGKPLASRTASLTALMPKLPGFTLHLIGRFDDASILGPGAHSVAYTYTSSRGAYVTAQMWATTDLDALTSYTYRNCLMFHGQSIAAQTSFLLSANNAATLYGVLLPADTVGGGRAAYSDVEWTTAIRHGGKTQYVRVALSAPPEGRSVWPGPTLADHTIVKPSGVLALSLPPDTGTWPVEFGRATEELQAFSLDFDRGLHIAATGSAPQTTVQAAS